MLIKHALRSHDWDKRVGFLSLRSAQPVSILASGETPGWLSGILGRFPGALVQRLPDVRHCLSWAWRRQIGLLLLYRTASLLCSNLSAWAQFCGWASSGVPGLMVLGNFNLPSLGMRSEIAQEFMATVATVELAKLSRTQFIAVVMHPVFSVRFGEGGILISLLPWTDHSLVSLKFLDARPFCRENRPFRPVHPRQLIDPTGFERQLGVIPENQLLVLTEVLWLHEIAKWQQFLIKLPLSGLSTLRVPDATHSTWWNWENLNRLRDALSLPFGA